jgi:hypothetical protein
VVSLSDTLSIIVSRIHLTVACIAATLLSGCASVGEKVGSLLASNATAIGVVDGHILRGQASFTKAREATVLLKGTAGASLSCFGPLRFNSSSSGWVDLACNNGQSTVVAFRSLTALSGAGRGMLGGHEFSFTFGLEAEQAAAFLEVPQDSLVEPVEKPGASSEER